MQLANTGVVTTNQGLYLYADVFGVPREIAVPIVQIFLGLIEHNGMEYACTRFKAVKTAFIRDKAGMSLGVTWFAMKDKKTFSGPFGALQNWCRSSYKRWSKAIKLLQIYTTLYSPSVTPSQETKFLDGVTSLNVGIPDVLNDALRLATVSLGLCMQPELPLPLPLWSMPVSSNKRAPHPNGRSYPEDTSLMESLSYTRLTHFGLNIRSKYKRIFDAVEADIDFEDCRDAPDLIDYRDSVGKIGFIQEQGFKLRAVANPGRVYQMALQPLGKRLFGTLAKLPWDCTHDQQKAVPVLQEALKQKKAVFSVDLSGATDYFPLDLQMTVLRSMLPHDQDHVELFHDLCRAPWLYGDSGKVIRWSRGQPLGLFPSFAAFALTHGLLLYALNGYKHANMFYVLGDDVVITDSQLYKRYMDVLSHLQCPVSEQKSLSSTDVAEFAGLLITANQTVVQTKWRNVSDDSFLDIVRNIGQKGLRLLKRRQRKVATKLMEVPDFMGGLGFNPQGKPLEERIFDALNLLGDKETTTYLMSLNKHINDLNYYDRSAFRSTGWFTNHATDFDKKSKAYVRVLLPRLLYWYEISGKNLFSCDQNLDLGIEGLGTSRTLLERYENILGIR